MIRTGTSYFVSRAAANRYYADYCPDKSKAFVAAYVGRKLAAGEIHIGRPARKAGQSVGTIAGEGRYYLVEEDATTVPMGWPDKDQAREEKLRDQIANGQDIDEVDCG